MRLRAWTAAVGGVAVAAGLLVAAPPAVAADAPRPIVSGWFGWWASDASVTQMTSSADGVVGEVAMFWWSFQGEDNPLCVYDNGDYDKDGNWGDCLTDTKTPWTTAKFDRQRKALQDAGIKINASITDLGSTSKGKLSEYLASGKNRRAYAKLITDYAVKAGVDGIDLDWEVFAFHDGRDSWTATKPRWVAMIKELSKNLRAAGLTLRATVPGGVPPFSGSGEPNPGTGYWVYAWDEITPYVDRLNIMAYDYSWSVPGPIGPNSWATLVADSAVKQVGQEYADRVWIGAPQYGRNWPVASGSGWTVDDECPAGWKPKAAPARTTVTPMSAREIAAREKVDPTWDAKAGEWTFDYWVPTAGKVEKKNRQCDIQRRVWFADTRSALARASIVPDLRIGGIAVWDFGTVPSDFYSRLADYGREIAPAGTTVKLKAPKATTHGRTITVRVATESRAGAAKGAEATLFFTPRSGSPARSKVETTTLDAGGKGTFRVPAETSGTWTVEVEGSWSRGAGMSQAQTTVRYAVQAEASAPTVDVGTPVTITGDVSPGSAGLVVTVQRRSGKGAWRDVSSTTTGAQGAVSATIKPTVAGEFAYRLVVPESGGLAQGASARIAITAR
ncbi:MAG: glycosyl hydrolase family 18 protein [Candidatus Nanopelagicales bacterium]